MQPYTYRPVFGRFLAIATAALCALAFVLIMISDGVGAGAQALPWLVLIGGIAWLLFFTPCVVVDDSGVRIVNVLRSIHLPWPSIQRIDTKWSLTLVTAIGTYSAWAAPAPSRMSARRLSRQEGVALPESTYVGEGVIRPGDAPGSPSGDAALVIRRRWDELREAGHLDSRVLEHDKPQISWHLPALAMVGIALVVALITLL